MTTATLTREGEQFRYVADDGVVYEGELSASPSRPTELTLVVRSIRPTGPDRPVRLGHKVQRAVAVDVKRLAEREQPGCEVRVVDTPEPVALRRARRPRR